MNHELTPEQQKGIEKAESDRREACNKILAKDFIKLVASMREAQNRYFKNGRKPSDLQDSKDLEYKVDQYIKSYFSNQTSLF